MYKVLLVYNPFSGHRNISGKLDFIIGKFEEKGALLQPYRINPACNEDERILNILQNDNYKYIVVSGGDGTINSIANLILKNGIDIPMGIIPSGTCNDFARSLDIPGNLSKCIDVILKGNYTNVDVGLINGSKYFLSTCAGGIFVDVSYNTSSDLKKKLGPIAYYLKALTELTGIKPLKIRVKTETEDFEQNLIMFIVLNGRHAAGFNNIYKGADIADGYMDIILIKHCSHIEIVAMAINALKSDFMNDKNVMRVKASYCEIISDDDVALSVDGERWDNFPINVRVINKALKVFVP